MATKHHSISQEWPTALNSSLAWDRKQFTSENTYIHVLSANEKSEINAALNAFKGLVRHGWLQTLVQKLIHNLQASV